LQKSKKHCNNHNALQQRIMIGALKTAHFTLIFVGNGSHALFTLAPALRKLQVCLG